MRREDRREEWWHHTITVKRLCPVKIHFVKLGFDTDRMFLGCS